MNLPDKIAKYLQNETFTEDRVGMSDSSVFFFGDKVLKIQKQDASSENEYRMMKWLEGRLPVPRVLEYEIVEEKSYILMSRCNGMMLCDAHFMENPMTQIHILARGLKSLWSTDISQCPSNQRLIHKLKEAEHNVKSGMVDMDNVELTTFGKEGFADPEALLQWLYDNQPEEEIVLSHGDYCLPNVFGQENYCTGFIDLGKTGIADKWCDIALCYRSLSNNYSGRYHSRAYSGLDDSLLFKELGVEPNWQKIRYYILLDELF